MPHAPHLMVRDQSHSLGAWLASLALLVLALPGTWLGGLWASVGLVSALLASVLVRWGTKTWPKPSRAWSAFLGLFLLWGFLGSFWAKDPAEALHITLKLASFMGPLLLLLIPEVQERLVPHGKILKAWPYLAGLSALGLAAEIALNGPLLHALRGPEGVLTGYNRGFSYAMMLIWPLAAGLWVTGRKALLGALIVAVLPALALTLSRATLVGEAFAAAVVVAAFLMPVWTVRGLGALLFLSGFWPMWVNAAYLHCPALVDKLTGSWAARFQLWDNLSYRILERPLSGWGLGNSHLLPIESPNVALYTVMPGPAAHSHNMFCQLWVEMGIPGILFGLVFGALTLRAAARLPDGWRPFALGAWAAGWIIALCAYDFWTDSLWAMFALVGLAFALGARHAKDLLFQGENGIISSK